MTTERTILIKIQYKKKTCENVDVHWLFRLGVLLIELPLAVIHKIEICASIKPIILWKFVLIKCMAKKKDGI